MQPQLNLFTAPLPVHLPAELRDDILEVLYSRIPSNYGIVVDTTGRLDAARDWLTAAYALLPQQSRCWAKTYSHAKATNELLTYPDL